MKTFFKIIFWTLVLGFSLQFLFGSDKQPVLSAHDKCMEQHRWNTTSVNTARFAVQVAYHQQGKGELAKRISDRQAVELVYCSK